MFIAVIETLGRFFGNDVVGTIGLCVLACLSVAIVMRFFIKQVFKGIDDYASKAYEVDSKSAGIYSTVKSAIYTLIAFVLTGVALAMLFKVCKFPFNNSIYLAWLYYIPMVAIQFFLDKNMKTIACKIFGLELPNADEEDEEEEKPKKQKIFTKKVRYTIDENGNEVAID